MHRTTTKGEDDMTMQHTSNSNSEKPAPEARKADGERPGHKFKVGDVVRYVNRQGVDLGTRTIKAIYEETRPWEAWMVNRYYIEPTDTPWFAVAEECLTLIVPALPHGCGSWIVTSPSGQAVELFERANAVKAAAQGWKVETAIDYLHRFNSQIRAKSTEATA